MFFFKINDKEYKVYFQHEKEQSTTVDKETGEIRTSMHPYETQCGIVQMEKDKADEETVGVGLSSCSINDQFSYDKGRKLSLRRAIKDAGIAREGRDAIWTAYFDNPQ
jgi:hypothetical protein